MDGDSAAVKRLIGGEDQDSSQEREERQSVTQVSQKKDVGPVMVNSSVGHLTRSDIVYHVYRK